MEHIIRQKKMALRLKKEKTILGITKLISELMKLTLKRL